MYKFLLPLISFVGFSVFAADIPNEVRQAKQQSQYYTSEETQNAKIQGQSLEILRDQYAHGKTLWFSLTEEPLDLTNSTYSSLAELKRKASTSKIKFVHNLSEFTYSKMHEEIRNFFTRHNGLVDENSTPAPHVEVIGNFAIDTKAPIDRSRFGGIRFGQDIVTKQLLAFKPLKSVSEGFNVQDSEEVYWLKNFNRFRGIINGQDIRGITNDWTARKVDLSYIGMDLIDGLNFREISRENLFNKINHHARYLIAYNLVKAFEDFMVRAIKQSDRETSNFMVCSNFDVAIIDFEYLDPITKENQSDRPRFHTSMISQIFIADGEWNVANNLSAIKKYQHGTFGKLIEFIGNEVEKNSPYIYVDEIIKVLPELP